MGKATFYIVNRDQNLVLGPPRSHPHEVVLQKSKGEYQLFFHNCTTSFVPVNCPTLQIDFQLPPGGRHDVKIDAANNPGVHAFKLFSRHAICETCGQTLPKEMQVPSQSGASRDGDADGDPIIIIDPAA